jgi:hypothetical protein
VGPTYSDLSISIGVVHKPHLDEPTKLDSTFLSKIRSWNLIVAISRWVPL